MGGEFSGADICGDEDTAADLSVIGLGWSHLSSRASHSKSRTAMGLLSPEAPWAYRRPVWKAFELGPGSRWHGGTCFAVQHRKATPRAAAMSLKQPVISAPAMAGCSAGREWRHRLAGPTDHLASRPRKAHGRCGGGPAHSRARAKVSWLKFTGRAPSSLGVAETRGSGCA